MAYYIVALCNDQTLMNERIRSSTVNEYLKAAARLSAPRKKLGPTKNAFGQKSTFMKAILDEHKRWEKMPNRREPITPNMLYVFAFTTQSEHIDSKNRALYDWFVLALCLGLRKSEWCQDKVELGKTKLQPRILLAPVEHSPLMILNLGDTMVPGWAKILSEIKLSQSG